MKIRNEIENWKENINTLKKNALNQNITHEVIANRTGYKRSAITRFFSCKHCPSLIMFISIAECLDIEINLIKKNKNTN